MDSLRFFIIAILGMLIDMLITYSLIFKFSFQYHYSLLIGLFVASCINYFFHEFWTFSNSHKNFSFNRISLYLLSVFLVLTTRFTILSLVFYYSNYKNMFLVLLCMKFHLPLTS